MIARTILSVVAIAASVNAFAVRQSGIVSRTSPLSMVSGMKHHALHGGDSRWGELHAHFRWFVWHFGRLEGGGKHMRWLLEVGHEHCDLRVRRRRGKK
ncbi:hypothetical protein ACHAXS_006991 [Conticribra weissflogii]